MPGLIIRADQLKTLDEYSQRAFADELVNHLRVYAPKLAEVVGEAGTRQIVESEIGHAGTYGITNKGPVRFFLELTCSFGSGFDTDPQLLWASDTLGDPSLLNDIARSDLLYDRMLNYVDSVCGPDQKYAIQALTRLLETDFGASNLKDVSEGRLTKQMASVYPEKFDFIGKAVASNLVQQAREEASQYGLPEREGTAALTALKFAMGHQVCHDPYYPWISSVLTDSRIVDGEHRLSRLLNKLRTYGTHVATLFRSA